MKPITRGKRFRDFDGEKFKLPNMSVCPQHNPIPLILRPICDIYGHLRCSSKFVPHPGIACMKKVPAYFRLYSLPTPYEMMDAEDVGSKVEALISSPPYTIAAPCLKTQL